MILWTSCDCDPDCCSRPPDICEICPDTLCIASTDYVVSSLEFTALDDVTTNMNIAFDWDEVLAAFKTEQVTYTITNNDGTPMPYEPLEITQNGVFSIPVDTSIVSDILFEFKSICCDGLALGEESIMLIFRDTTNILLNMGCPMPLNFRIGNVDLTPEAESITLLWDEVTDFALEPTEYILEYQPFDMPGSLVTNIEIFDEPTESSFDLETPVEGSIHEFTLYTHCDCRSIKTQICWLSPN